MVTLTELMLKMFVRTANYTVLHLGHKKQLSSFKLFSLPVEAYTGHFSLTIAFCVIFC